MIGEERGGDRVCIVSVVSARVLSVLNNEVVLSRKNYSTPSPSPSPSPALSPAISPCSSPPPSPAWPSSPITTKRNATTSQQNQEIWIQTKGTKQGTLHFTSEAKKQKMVIEKSNTKKVVLSKGGGRASWVLETIDEEIGIVAIKNVHFNVCLCVEMLNNRATLSLKEYEPSEIFWWKIIHCDFGLIDYSNWMRDMCGYLGDKLVTEVVVPGSHDSCAYNFTEKSPYGPDAISWLIDNPTIGNIAQSIVVKWSQTQNRSTIEQLRDGIRYLDLRIGFVDNGFYLVHGLCGPSIDEVLSEIEQFVAQCPQEIIILDFNHFYNMKEEQHTQLINIIHQKLLKSMIPYTQDIPLTFNSLWESQKTIFVMYHHASCAAFPLLWPQQCINSPWPDKTDPNDLFEYLRKCPRTPNFFVSQAILTPRVSTVVSSVLPTQPSSLKNFTDMANITVIDWLMEQVKAHPLNIIIVDFYESINFVEAIILINQFKYLKQKTNHSTTQNSK